jgi:hypothetical protein
LEVFRRIKVQADLGKVVYISTKKLGVVVHAYNSSCAGVVSRIAVQADLGKKCKILLKNN